MTSFDFSFCYIDFGDKMKKLIIHSFFFIGCGFFLGNFVFQNRLVLRNQKDIYYFLEEGIYFNREIIQNHLTGFKQKVIEYENDRYHVYVGITKDKEIAEKLKQIYKEKGYVVTIKEKSVSSEEFSENVNQFDLLVHSAKTEEEILKIEEVVLANYHELFKR